MAEKKSKSKLSIEVRVNTRTLLVGGKKLDLDDNFAGAGVFNVKNRPDETILDLNYRKNEKFSSHNEGEKVSKFIRASKYDTNKIQIYSCRPEDSKREIFLGVSITGKFKANVYDK